MSTTASNDFLTYVEAADGWGWGEFGLAHIVCGSLVKLAHPRPDVFRYFEKPGAMPLPSFAPNEKADLLRDTDPDLVFLMASHRVPEELQLAIFATHDTMALFSKLDRDEEGIRAFLATEWDLRPSNGVASRRTISLLLTAWEAAREQVAKENQARAEARISGKPIDIIAHDFELMKKACGKEHGRDFTKPQIPCRVMVQDKMRAIENNDPQADELQECLADDKSTHEELLAAEIGKDSRIAITKAAKVKGKIPRNAEELRAAHKLVGHSWLFARAKQNSRSWLKDLLPDTFVEFSDFILGERVAGIEIKFEDKVAMYPSFKLLLSFEFALRKSATEWTREGRGTLAECMKLVCKDRELRDMHFLEPLKFRAEASRLEDPRNVGSGALAMYPANNFSTFGKGGDGKGKGKHGKGKTSDGKQMAVCYALTTKIGTAMDHATCCIGALYVERNIRRTITKSLVKLEVPGTRKTDSKGNRNDRVARAAKVAAKVTHWQGRRSRAIAAENKIGGASVASGRVPTGTEGTGSDGAAKGPPMTRRTPRIVENSQKGGRLQALERQLRRTNAVTNLALLQHESLQSNAAPGLPP